MRKFKDRIKFYLIGFGLGIISVAFIFGNRGCAWLPENKVKNNIAEKEIIYSDSIKDIMTCANITTSDIYNLLNSSGDVDFSESSPNLKYKKYVFYGDNNLRVVFEIHDNFSEIVEIKTKCSSSLSHNHKQSLPLPQEIVTKIIESHEFNYYDGAKCQIKCYNLNDKDVRKFHKTAYINMDKSVAWPRLNSNKIINKYYYLEGKLNGKKYGIVYEIGENRTRIKYIEGENNCDCN